MQAKAAGKDLGKGVSPSGAVDKAKGLGKELGRNVPDPSAAADKIKGNVSPPSSAEPCRSLATLVCDRQGGLATWPVQQLSSHMSYGSTSILIDSRQQKFLEVALNVN